MRSIRRLNEEIARWAFEILFQSNRSWHIAFTNPTAGPWKTIKAASLASGAVGEVYRFLLEEDRPDIIMYHDALCAVVIFEAKDSLAKLLEGNQAQKSAEVVAKLAGILRQKGSNQFWRGREDYKVILGLLWGSTGRPEPEENKAFLYQHYHDLIRDNPYVCTDLIVGVETLFRDNALSCSAFCQSYRPEAAALGDDLVRSFTRPSGPD